MPLFQFDYIISCNHVKRETSILLHAIVAFLIRHGFVRRVFLILPSLNLFLILLADLDEKYLEWELK